MPLIAILLAYLLGSLSTGVIISKILKTADPRDSGSGNAGATNVLRIAGKKQALFVLIGDLLKGLIAVLIGHLLHVSGMALGLVAFAAVVGHIFPVFFRFKGGKGVATAVGAIFGLSVLCGILMAVTWIAVAYITRYSSLASLVTIIVMPIYLALFSFSFYVFPGILIAVLIILKHADNISRLRMGTESKILI